MTDQHSHKLWNPPDRESTSAWHFMQNVNRKRGQNLNSWEQLHEWSVNHISDFWEEVLQQHPIIHHGTYTQVVDENARMDSIPTWFDGLMCNFAENILFSPHPDDHSRTTTDRKPDDAVALTEIREGCTEIRDCTWRELRSRVGILSNALRARGVSKGDRVAVIASNSLDTITVFYAVTALGGIFSSSSVDMGTKGVLDRLLQIKPRYIFVDDGALYNGKTLDLRDKMTEIEAGMRGISELQGLISLPRWREPLDICKVPRCETLQSFLSGAKGNDSLRFERVKFRDPFLVVYSSGTTGQPKCIVHCTGGILLNGKKEANLHRDADRQDPRELCALQYTTTGWIMYLSNAMAPMSGARAVLYDGSPFQPDLTTFVRMLGEQKVTDLGVSPRYMQTLATAKPHPVVPTEVTDLSRLRRVTSTGMVLSEAQFDWFYRNFPAHTQLANISGGTDLAACIIMDNTLRPLYSGGCMAGGLGIKVEVYDSAIESLDGKPVTGRPVPVGESGELVVTKAFPTMPVRFWGDGGGRKYFDAYFARFDNVWTHGDFINIHPRNGQIYLHGRADGVLNPSGVRFGSAEIYNILDHHFGEEIQDSICVGQRRPQDVDESVMLFLLMKPGKKFTTDLVRRVRNAIAQDGGKRQVPKYIFETPEIPTTINLKKVELPVKQIVSGKIIKPSDTLANKECLDFYYQFAKVEELVLPKSKL